MKILFLHPYGCLGHWNHRLARQAELMSERCELMMISEYTRYDVGIEGRFMEKVKKAIGEFKPDIIYANGFLVADMAIDMFENVVFDMGSFMGRNALIELWGGKYPRLLDEPGDELRDKILRSRGEVLLRREGRVFKDAKAVISWEGNEAELAKRIYGDWGNIKEISMMFYKLPEPIAFGAKKKRAMTIMVKCGKKGKNMSLCSRVKNSAKFPVLSVGTGGETWKGSVHHDELMDELNQSRVYFAPFFCGGIGTMVEAMRLGCNVIAYSWHPFLNYINDELIIDAGGKDHIVYKGAEFIEKAMDKYYPLKKELPTEQEQLDKLFKVFEEIT